MTKWMSLRDNLNLFTDATFLRFIMVGVVNTVVGSAVMFILYNVFHAGYWLSTASNYLFGSIVSYLLNKHFTFHYQEKGCKSLFSFTLNIIVCYLLAYGIAKPVIRWLIASTSVTMQENVSMLMGMILFVFLNYLGQRFFTFNSHEI